MLDDATRREIDSVTWKALKDAGIVRPPVPVEGILEHLRLHRHYYDLEDPSFLDRAKYKLIVHGHKLVDLLRKVKLSAVLLFDEKRVVLDVNLPEIKHDWASCHESTHRILEWHRPYFYGDTAQTLDPEWQERLEEEANYGASALMFCGPIFNAEAKEVAPDWARVRRLVDRYGKSITATVRRYVEHGPARPMAFMASTPAWKEKPADQPQLWRHFARSPEFARRFSAVTARDLISGLNLNSTARRGGMVADGVRIVHRTAEAAGSMGF